MTALLAAACASGEATSSMSPSGVPGTAAVATPRAVAGRTPAASAAIVARVTLAADGCIIEPLAEPLPAGPMAIEVLNETDEPSGFDLIRVRDGFGFDDVSAHIDRENEQVETGAAPIGFPSSAVHLDQAAPGAGGSDTITHVAGPGTYGIVCIVRAGPDPLRFDLVGPIVVE
jgi:hypothetical protein